MLTIKEKEDNYRLEAIEAVVTDNTIIPGVKGKEIDLDKSYEEMKSGGVFREEAIVFKDIEPLSILSNNQDKYIIKGSTSKNEVSLIYIVNNLNDIEKVENYQNITIFMDSKYLTYDRLSKLKNREVYSYGNGGKYTEEIITKDNKILSKFNRQNSNYCLLKESDEKVLESCMNKKMSTVIPNIIGDYYEVKENISKGSIILLNSLNNVSLIEKYINSKGYKIVSLSKLLEE